MRLTGKTAIEYAEIMGLPISCYTTPIEEARDDLTVDEAEDIVREDDQLIYFDANAWYVETDDTYAYDGATVLQDGLVYADPSPIMLNDWHALQRPIFQHRIAWGAARREGREPSHDGEYMMLYWTDDSTEGWIAEDNAGVCCTDDENYVEVCRDATEELQAEAAAIQTEIDDAVESPGNIITGAGGHATEILREMGWILPAPDPNE